MVECGAEAVIACAGAQANWEFGGRGASEVATMRVILCAVVFTATLSGCGDTGPRSTGTTYLRASTASTGSNGGIKDQADRPLNPDLQAVQDAAKATPQGKAEVDRLEGKDAALTRFQREHNISDAIAEAAIKEWVTSHGGNFDWVLEDVKAICLRMKR